MKELPTEAFIIGLCVLTTYRLVRLFAYDEFPPTAWFRHTVEAKFGEDSSWSYLASCFHCMSWWMALVVYGSAWAWSDQPWWIFVALALSTSAIVGLIADNLLPDE